MQVLGKGSIHLILEVGNIYLEQVEFDRIEVFVGVSFPKFNVK